MMTQVDLQIVVQFTEILTFIAGAVWFVSKLNSQISIILNQNHLERESNVLRFSEIETQLRELIKATVQLARQEERLSAQDARLQELSHRIDIIKEKRALTINAAPKRSRRVSST